MYPTNDTYKEKVKELDRVWETKVEIEHKKGTLHLTDKDIALGGMSVTEKTQPGEDFTVGGTVASDLNLKIINKPEYNDIDFTGAKIKPYVSLIETQPSNKAKTTKWTDLSGNGNHGELKNFDFTENSGWVDGRLKFDGVDDYVQLPELDLDPNNFTIQVDDKIRAFNGDKVITENMEDIAYTWKQFEGMTWEEVINL